VLSRRELRSEGRIDLHRIRGGVALGGRRAVAPLAQPAEQRAPAAVERPVAHAELIPSGLADPPLVRRARGAQLAHLPAGAAGEERHRRLAAQERTAADVARDVGLVRADVAKGRQSRPSVATPRSRADRFWAVVKALQSGVQSAARAPPR